MRRDLWPLKAVFALAALIIGGGDLTFPGDPVSPGVLLFLAFLLAIDALNDRSMQGIERQRADDESAAKAAADRAERARGAEEAAENLKEARRAFAAAKSLGVMMANYVHYGDLLEMKDLAPEQRQKLQERQREIRVRVQEIRRSYSHLDEADGA
ncbi:MAG: hypothetical protein ACLGIE_15865 [Alphaproteobacteria bacterium]